MPPQQAAIVRAIGEGRQVLPANRKEGLALLEQVHQAYPDYDEHKVKDWQKATTEYTSGKTGAGLVLSLIHISKAWWFMTASGSPP